MTFLRVECCRCIQAKKRNKFVIEDKVGRGEREKRERERMKRLGEVDLDFLERIPTDENILLGLEHYCVFDPEV